MNQKDFRAIFASILVPEGFTSARNTFYRRLGNVFLIIDLQKSAYGGSYYVNLGLYVDEVGLTAPPPFHRTHLMGRLESIVPKDARERLVPALDLEIPMNAEERSSIIREMMEQFGLPYLNPLATVDGIADFLSPEKKNYRGVTLALREVVSRLTGRTDGLLPEQRG